MKKVDVNGESADPLWEHVKKEKPGLVGMKRMYGLSHFHSPSPADPRAYLVSGTLKSF